MGCRASVMECQTPVLLNSLASLLLDLGRWAAVPVSCSCAGSACNSMECHRPGPTALAVPLLLDLGGGLE